MPILGFNETAAIESFTGGFTALNFTEVYIPLLTYVISMVVYAVIVWHFYRFLSKRNLIEVNLDKYNYSEHPNLSKVIHYILFVIKFVLFFPIITFISFGVLSGLIFFLSRDQEIQSILLTSISLVSAIRATAYYSEDLAKDLAKMLPFALLGVYMIDPAFFSVEQIITKLYQLPSFLPLLTAYLAFAIMLEVVLKILRFVFIKLEPKRMTQDKTETMKDI